MKSPRLKCVSLAIVIIAQLACAGEPPGQSAGSDTASSNASEAERVTDKSSRGRNSEAALSDDAPTRDACVVATVTDGDSFRCRDNRRVRLLLLDAPEMDQVPFGTRSRDALRELMPRGDTVWLEFDIERQDRYGRTLAHAFTASAGGVHLNIAHARNGWAVAVVFPPNVRHIEQVRAAVRDARSLKQGLWSDGSFTCTPQDHKRGSC